MRRLVHLLVTIALVVASMASAAPRERQVPIGQLTPTRTRLKTAKVEAHLARWRADAARRGLSLVEYAERELKPRSAAKPVSVAVAPDGSARVVGSGQHRIAALTELSRQTGVELAVGARVERHLRGAPRQAAHLPASFTELVTQGQGWRAKNWRPPAGVTGATLKVPLHALRPSQMEIGMAEVDDRLGRWRAAAKRKGVNIATYAREVLAPKLARNPIEAIIDPDGAVRPTDGHHRITALLRIAAETGVAVPVGVKILEDYRGHTKESYAQDLGERLGKAYFTPEVARLPPAERIDHLPSSFDEMRDSPLRSLMGAAFRRLKIDGLRMADYAEFKSGNHERRGGLIGEMKKAGLIPPEAKEMPAELAHDKRAIDLVASRLLRPSARRYLTSLVTEADRERLVERLGRFELGLAVVKGGRP